MSIASLASADPQSRHDPDEPLALRLRRYGLALAYLLRPVRLRDAPAIALGATRDVLLGAAASPGDREPVGRMGFAGLVGDPSPSAILAAARLGFYANAHMGPLKYWSPRERAIMALGDVTLTKRFRRSLRTTGMSIAFDQDFDAVVRACAAPRAGRAPLTWITSRAIRLQRELHTAGLAHSVEVRDETGALVGGVFGLAVGPVFSALSMFHTANDASKIAIVSLYHHLESWGFLAVDHQQMSPWVEALGGRTIARDAYRDLLRSPDPALPPGRWTALHTPAETAVWQPRPTA